MATCLTVLVLCGCAYGVFRYTEHIRDFNSKVWIATPCRSEARHTVRGRMAADLIRNHLRLGMSRQEVIQLLDKPDYPFNKQLRRDMYDLGYFDRWMEIDPSILWLQYDAKDNLIGMGVSET